MVVRRRRGQPAVSVVIRRPVVADAEALADLHLAVWAEAYAGLIPAAQLAARRRNRHVRVDRWRARIESDPEGLRVAERDGRLLGFAQAGPGRDRPEPSLPGLELMALYVRSACYGTGVGFSLFDAVIGDAAAYLWVLDGNDRAIAFYRRQGFELDGAVKREPPGVERRMVRGRV
ncbi:MAG: GNAT family N-acetyltransferase, partial [Nocardioides sp.]|nr:GNAT family N-acetyltransferase [Nocardioides sp.]